MKKNYAHIFISFSLSLSPNDESVSEVSSLSFHSALSFFLSIFAHRTFAMHNLKVTFLVYSPRFGYHNVVEQVRV